MKVSDAIEIVNEIDKAISIQEEIIGRIERHEVLLSSEYIHHLKTAISALKSHKYTILNTELVG